MPALLESGEVSEEYKALKKEIDNDRRELKAKRKEEKKNGPLKPVPKKN